MSKVSLSIVGLMFGFVAVIWGAIGYVIAGWDAAFASVVVLGAVVGAVFAIRFLVDENNFVSRKWPVLGKFLRWGFVAIVLFLIVVGALKGCTGDVCREGRNSYEYCDLHESRSQYAQADNAATLWVSSPSA